MITNETYWQVLGQIDGNSRRQMNTRNKGPTHGSERMHLIRVEIPYNPLEILREASRIAVEAGVSEGDRWGIDNDGAWVGSDYSTTNFYESRKNDNRDGDGDKYVALRVLASVCEYVKRKERQ
jgi:hypothetical protein